MHNTIHIHNKQKVTAKKYEDNEFFLLEIVIRNPIIEKNIKAHNIFRISNLILNTYNTSLFISESLSTIYQKFAVK